MVFRNLFVALLVCATAKTVQADSTKLLYVTLLEAKKIVCYHRDAKTGDLERKSEFTCPAEPGVLCTSADKQFLFTAFRSTGELASFQIDPDSGELTHLGTFAGGEDPCYLVVDQTQKFLLTAYYVGNKVTVHRINDGKLSQQPIQTVRTGKNAHGIAIDSKNEMVFVTHTGANRVHQFNFDDATGELKASSTPFTELSPGDEPRHVALHPSDKWLYANNEAGDGLNVFNVDRESVSLKRIQKVPSIPNDFDKSKNTTARCEITRNGRFIYVANRGHNSIAGYAIDHNSGRVQSLGQFATETTPRSFTISPDGRFLYAAGQGSGKIAQYKIEPDGALTRTETHTPGPIPWCVLAVDLD